MSCTNGYFYILSENPDSVLFKDSSTHVKTILHLWVRGVVWDKWEQILDDEMAGSTNKKINVEIFSIFLSP